MNMKRKLIGIMFAIFGGAALLMGCPEPGQTCTFDSDCDFEGDICIDQQCVIPCTSDDDCSATEECLERPSGGASYCQPQAAQGCTDHGDCESDELCNFDTGVCEGDAPACTDHSDCD